MKKIMPTTYLLIAILLCLLVHFVAPIRYLIPWPWNLLGILPLLFGILINLAADRAFKQADTTVKPFKESSVLVQKGAFRLTRNPMYLGFIALLLGMSILLRSVSPYIVVVAFAVLIEILFIRVEERMLEAQFGDEWRRYRATVRKWI